MDTQVLHKKFPLVIAVACGILAVFLLQVYLKQREAQTLEKLKQMQAQMKTVAKPVEQPMGIVLVAKRDVPAEALIMAEDIEIRQAPLAFIQPGAAKALEGVIGQIAASPILTGEQILTTKLLPAGNIGKELSELTPKGKRAMTIPVDNLSALSGFLRPGNFVDVLALLSPVSAGSGLKQNKQQVTTVPFLQGIEVLAVGSESTAHKGSGGRKKEVTIPTAKSEVGTVTLSLSLQEALLLAYVQERGRVKLVMHAAQDLETETANSVSETVLMRYLNPEEATQPLTTPMKVDIYRGLNKESKSLSEDKY